MAAPRSEANPWEYLPTTRLFCNHMITAHAVRRKTAFCGKVGDKWWILCGKMLLLGASDPVFSRDELLRSLALLVNPIL
jgi:hypothetical protein